MESVPPLQVTKLVENYRSHEALLKLYSEQFYDGELVERASRGMTHSLCNWQHLPTKGIPLLFHGVQVHVDVYSLSQTACR